MKKTRNHYFRHLRHQGMALLVAVSMILSNLSSVYALPMGAEDYVETASATPSNLTEEPVPLNNPEEETVPAETGSAQETGAPLPKGEQPVETAAGTVVNEEVTIAPKKLEASSETFTWEVQDTNFVLSITGDPETMTAAITGVNQDCTGALVIPEEINGYTITRIGNNAFELSGIEAVTIPGSVTEIGMSAFRSCSKLTDVYLARGVEVISQQAFSYSGIKEIYLPSSLITIGKSAFWYCQKLTHISLPDSLEEIGSSAFEDTGIEELHIPGSVKTIGSMWAPGLFHYNGNANNTLKKVYVGEGVENIGGFEMCAALEEVHLPSTIKTIEKNAFSKCSSLTSIDIPDGTEIISDYAFDYTGLKHLVLPNTVRELGDHAFENVNFDNVVLSSQLKKIGASAFSTLLGAPIKMSDLPEGLEEIGQEAFTNIDWENIRIPSTVTSIGEGVFLDCKNMINITVDERNPVFSSENNCLINRETKTMLAWPYALNSSCIIPDGVTRIGRRTFYESKVTAVHLPATMKEIGFQAFYRAKELQKIYFNEGLETIERDAFENCSALKEIILPDTLTSLGNEAFRLCTSVEKIRLSGGLQRIPLRAFERDTSENKVFLRELVIPEGVKYLDGYTFYGCGIHTLWIPHSLVGTESNNFSYKYSDAGGYVNLVYYSGTEAEWNNINFSYEDSGLRDVTVVFNGNLDSPQMSDVGWIEKDGHPWQYRRPDGNIINSGIYNLAYLDPNDDMYIGNFCFENGVVKTGWDDQKEHYYCGLNEEYPYGMEKPLDAMETTDVLKDSEVMTAGRFLDDYDFALTTFSDDLLSHAISVAVFSPDHIAKFFGLGVEYLKQLKKGNIKGLDAVDSSYWYKRPEVTAEVLQDILEDLDEYQKEKKESIVGQIYKAVKVSWKTEKTLFKTQAEYKVQEWDGIANPDAERVQEAKQTIVNNIAGCVDSMVNLNDDLKQGFTNYADTIAILDALEEACGYNTLTSENSDSQDALLRDAIEEIRFRYQTQYITETVKFFADCFDASGAWLAFLDTDSASGLGISLMGAGKELLCDTIKIESPIELLLLPLKLAEFMGQLDGHAVAMESVLKTFTLRNCLQYKLNQLHYRCLRQAAQHQEISDRDRQSYELLFDLMRVLTIKQYNEMAEFYKSGVLGLGSEPDKAEFLQREVAKLKAMSPYSYMEEYNKATRTGRYTASDFEAGTRWNGRTYISGGYGFRNQWVWISGYKYYFGENGEAYYGLHFMADGTRYFSNKDKGAIHAGAMQTGVVEFDDYECYFAKDTGLMVKDAYINGHYYDSTGKRDPSRETAFTNGLKEGDPVISQAEYMVEVRMNAENADIYEESEGLLLQVRNREVVEPADDRIQWRNAGDCLYLYFPPEMKLRVELNIAEETENMVFGITEYQAGSPIRKTIYSVVPESGESYVAQINPSGGEGEEQGEIVSLINQNSDGQFAVSPEVKTEDEIIYYTLKVEISGDGRVVAGGNTASEVDEVAIPEGGFYALKAVPEEGGTFEGWQDEEGELLSSEETYQWIAEQSSRIKAVFRSVNTNSVTGVTLNRSTVTLVKGGTVTLNAVIVPSDADNQKVSWESSNTEVAEVDDTGKVTAVGPGTAVITVKTEDGEKTAACRVTVSLATPVPGTIKNVSEGVSFSWSRVDGAEKYRVYRKTSGSSWAKLADSTALTYIDKTVESGTKYSYTVRCISPDGKTLLSDSDGTGKTVTFIATPAVNAPTSAAAGVRVSWPAVPGAAKYVILRHVGPGQPAWKWLMSVSAGADDTMSCIDSSPDVVSGTWYAYTVRAIAGDGTYSGQVGGRSIKYLAPVTVNKAQSISSGVRVTFTNVDGGYTYRLYRSTKGSNGKFGNYVKIIDQTKVWNGSPESVWIQDTTAKSGTTYRYYVRCVSKDGKVPLSSYKNHMEITCKKP